MLGSRSRVYRVHLKFSFGKFNQSASSVAARLLVVTAPILILLSSATPRQRVALGRLEELLQFRAEPLNNTYMATNRPYILKTTPKFKQNECRVALP